MKQPLAPFAPLFSHVSKLLVIGSLTVFLAACGQDQSPVSPQDHQRLEKPPIPDPYPEALKPPPPKTLPQNTYPHKKPPPTTLNNNINKNIPIILVHGLGGWGRDEFLGYRYWGGLHDVQNDLNARGFKVFTAAIGPISSNWDRAAELFAQIKGGCVDYGAAHSKKFGHDRFDKAKCYKGFYPEWDEKHPVNLIGHSMGGQTSRMLVKLLEDGSPPDASDNNVFTGGRIGWVKALMTLSAPNSGSPAADTITQAIPTFREILGGAAALAGIVGEGKALPYNFDLGQWGLVRRKNESLKEYKERVLKSKIWTTNDNAAYDLSPDGTAELNAFIGRSKHVIYTSWYNSASYEGIISGWHYPKINMFGPLKLVAYPYPPPARHGLGNVQGSSVRKAVTYDPTWWENDGLVPIKSMTAPLTGKKAIPYTGQTLIPGEWYDLGKLEGWDHFDIIGWLSEKMDVRPFYRHQVEFLNRIP